VDKSVRVARVLMQAHNRYTGIVEKPTYQQQDHADEGYKTAMLHAQYLQLH
jgi:hypothetical protein